MRVLDSPRLRGAFAVAALFSLLAGDFWRYTVGWVGYGVIAGSLLILAIALLVRDRHRHLWSVGRLPYPLLAFLALATLSITWSFYPGATALGLLATWVAVVAGLTLAVSVGWDGFARALATALKIILGASIVFELIVALFVRAPLLPFVTQPGVDYASYEGRLPKLLFWSRNELFEVLDGGRIQGIVGNSSSLGFIALLGVIVFAVRLADQRNDQRHGRGTTIAWLALAALTVVLTRSATITIAVVVLAAVVGAALLLRRAATPRGRSLVYGGMVAAIAVGAASAILLRSQILNALGKSDDLTGRLEIWADVTRLAQERPVFGWGWVSYWQPWVEPFDSLAFQSGVRQLHAHNAWLDVWLQLGVVGLIVFGALVLSTTLRAWLRAIDRPAVVPTRHGLPATRARYTAATLFPLLIVVALLVQSVAESRLLVEYGLVLLTVVAFATRADPGAVRGTVPDAAADAARTTTPPSA